MANETSVFFHNFSNSIKVFANIFDIHLLFVKSNIVCQFEVSTTFDFRDIKNSWVRL